MRFIRSIARTIGANTTDPAERSLANNIFDNCDDVLDYVKVPEGDAPTAKVRQIRKDARKLGRGSAKLEEDCNLIEDYADELLEDFPALKQTAVATATANATAEEAKREALIALAVAEEKRKTAEALAEKEELSKRFQELSTSPKSSPGTGKRVASPTPASPRGENDPCRCGLTGIRRPRGDKPVCESCACTKREVSCTDRCCCQKYDGVKCYNPYNGGEEQ